MEFVRIKKMNEAIVVAFDMCSSSDVLEGLTLKGETARLKSFIEKLKHYLANAQKDLPFDPYKFTGDGWILLFPVDTDGPKLLSFLRDFAIYFRKAFKTDVLTFLDVRPDITGLTFGVEKGPLVPMTIFQTQEYIGRALNIACRLQSAIKDKGGSPAYMALVSNSVFNSYFSPATGYVVYPVRRQLRNIQGGKAIHCSKIDLLNLKGRPKAAVPNKRTLSK